MSFMSKNTSDTEGVGCTVTCADAVRVSFIFDKKSQILTVERLPPMPFASSEVMYKRQLSVG